MILRSAALVVVVTGATLVASPLIGCGGAQPAANTPVAPPAADSAAATSAPTAATAAPAGPVWNRNASKDEQIAFMKANVAPRMGKVFQAHDAGHNASFGCVTCHGPAYKEPKEFLPHLTMTGGKLTAFAEKPEVSKFMAEKVVPEMAAAIGMKPYDPKTHDGFGCGGCHTIDMK